MRMRGLVAVVGVSAVCVATLIAQDVLTTLGVRPNEAKASLFEVLGKGSMYDNAAKTAFLKAATAEARVALVNGALTWAKEYTESPEFAKRYATTRTQSEPRLSGRRTWTAEEEISRRQAFLDQRIANEKKRLDEPPSPRQTPEQQQAQRKSTEDRIKAMETDRARYTDSVARADMRKPFEAEEKEVKEAHAKWEENYPPDYRVVVAKRLRDFLALSGTVDFGAKLVPCKNSWQHHSCFADPAYEKKSQEWKRLYRAGKPAVDAARTFATNWLGELEKK
jgi:hypothetical protein